MFEKNVPLCPLSSSPPWKTSRSFYSPWHFLTKMIKKIGVSASQGYHIVLDTFYPVLTRLFRVVSNFFRGLYKVELAIRMLSIFWIPFSKYRSFRSLAKVSPKMVGGFLNPRGSSIVLHFLFGCGSLS